LLVVKMAAKSRRKLGILVATVQHMASVGQLAQSARAKGVSVWVCLIGPAIGGFSQEAFEQLAVLSRITICRDAQDGASIPEDLLPVVDPGMLISSQRMLEQLARCDRWVVF
jgi:hypothetical protein